MTSAQKLIWDTAGRPDVPGAKAKLLKDHPARCAITGEQEPITADAKKALGENFTDHSLWSCHSGRVGQPALWCASGKGKTSPRLWTWVCTPGRELPASSDKAYLHVPGICQTNRGNTRPVITTLTHPPEGEWVVCIAISGQKHVLPYAATNSGAGEWVVRMEDTTITATPNQFHTVFSHVLALRRLGVHTDDIKTLTPRNLKNRDELAQFMHHAQVLEPYASAPLTDLALWCITKPIMEDTHEYPNP